LLSQHLLHMRLLLGIHQSNDSPFEPRTGEPTLPIFLRDFSEKGYLTNKETT
jgi:hypothetical protein